MKTAIIMGAGPAGLTAAYELLTKTDIKPLIIEMDSQVGGLSKTIDYKGNLIDIGGHRFFSKSERITDWWLKFLPLDEEVNDSVKIPLHYQNQISTLKIPSGETSNSGGRMLLRPRKSRIYYNDAFFDYPLSLNRETLSNFSATKISRIALSYLLSKLFPRRKETSLEDFFVNRFGKELYTTFFKGYTEKIWGVPCASIPADWGHQRIKDLNIGKAVLRSITSVFGQNKSLTQEGVSTSMIGQFLYPEKGPGQMWEAVAQKIRDLGGEILLSTAAEKINAGAGNRITSVTCKEIISGRTHELTGDYFFSSIPIRNLIQGLDETTVPERVKEIASGLLYRDFIITGMLFKRAGRLSANAIGNLTDNWIYLQDQNLTAGRLQIFNNWSPLMVKDNGTVWIGLEYFCSHSDPIWSMDPAEILDLSLSEIKKTGLVTTEEFLDGTVIKVPKAYPSYFGTYNQFPELQAYLDKFENLFPIGRNGMHRYNNTDHSMMTAMKAVENIICNQRSKQNIWEVNMEKNFHEEKTD